MSLCFRHRLHKAADNHRRRGGGGRFEGGESSSPAYIAGFFLCSALIQKTFSSKLNVQPWRCWKKSTDFSINKKGKYTLSQAASRQSLHGCTEAQLSTYHCGRQQVPVIITYGAPLSVFQHLHSALAYDGPTAKTNQRLLRSSNRDEMFIFWNRIFRLFFSVSDSAESWERQLFLLCDDAGAEVADWVALCLYNMLLMRYSH